MDLYYGGERDGSTSSLLFPNNLLISLFSLTLPVIASLMNCVKFIPLIRHVWSMLIMMHVVLAPSLSVTHRISSVLLPAALVHALPYCCGTPLDNLQTLIVLP